MITRDFAKKQIVRMAGLRGFPPIQEAVDELIKALQVAGDPKHAEGWVSGFLDDSTSETYCPSPGDIKRSLLDRKQAQQAIRKCGLCDGAGWVTVYRLVTYRAGTYQADRAELIALAPDTGKIETTPEKQIMDFRAKLGADQDILSAAKACACLPTSHKYFTGERQ